MRRLLVLTLMLFCVACNVLDNDTDDSPFVGELTVTDGLISDVSGDLPLNAGDPAPQALIETGERTENLRFALYAEECTGTGRLIQCDGGVEIYDPATGALLSTFATPQAATSVTVQDNLAYITWRSGDVLGGGGLVIADISTPENVVEVGAYPTLRHALTVDFANANTLYVLTMDSLHILDMSDPAAPRSIGTYTENVMLMDVIVVDDRAFVIQGSPCAPASSPFECDHHLLELDISTPDAPQSVQTIDLPDPETPYLYAEHRLTLIDGLLYVPVGDSRFVVMRG
ncbi:MAG: hypothetical protein RLP44_14585 [Aggregatilineales bacterium]